MCRIGCIGAGEGGESVHHMCLWWRSEVGTGRWLRLPQLSTVPMRGGAGQGGEGRGGWEWKEA